MVSEPSDYFDQANEIARKAFVFTLLTKLKESLCFTSSSAFNPSDWEATDGLLPRSMGHCAAVAYLVNFIFGGVYKSVKLAGQSHWFNCFDNYDVDLTGDQFGFPSIQIAPAGMLYTINSEDTAKVRQASELNEETIKRGQLLARNSIIQVLTERPLTGFTKI